MSVIIPIVRVAVTDFTALFARYDFAGLISTNFGINSSPMFGNLAKIFEEYAVTGFRL